MKQLAENILDIAENSVRAEAKHIFITLEEDTAAHTLRITVEDDGCGMTPETVRAVTDPFYTTRTTRRVGLGIPLFRMEAEMTGGALTLESEKGVGTRISALFRTDHLDAIPLGDVGQTLMILIGGSPHTEFHFAHRCGDQSVTLDTVQLREMLGAEVPLDTPEVLLWIRDYVHTLYAQLEEHK